MVMAQPTFSSNCFESHIVVQRAWYQVGSPCQNTCEGMNVFYSGDLWLCTWQLRYCQPLRLEVCSSQEMWWSALYLVWLCSVETLCSFLGIVQKYQLFIPWEQEFWGYFHEALSSLEEFLLPEKWSHQGDVVHWRWMFIGNWSIESFNYLDKPWTNSCACSRIL